MTEPTWPGFLPEPCTGCGCPADHHQPVCMAIIGGDGPRYCGCPSYLSPHEQQAELFASPGGSA